MKKILIITGVILVVALVIVVTVVKSKQGDVTVQTGKVARSNIASVVTEIGRASCRERV